MDQTAFHLHELTDRAHIASTFVQQAIGGHPALDAHTDLKRLYLDAVAALEALYQAAGQLEK